MPMKMPSHPGRILRANIEALGVTISEASDHLGVTRQQLYRVISGTSGITPEMALRIEVAIGGDAGHWLRMQSSFDLAIARSKKPGVIAQKIRAKAA
jgi:antitoxin HigA-1